MVEQYRLRAYYAPHRYGFWYLDEFTFFRQPTVACAYDTQGHRQPLACQSYRTNTRWRTVGALNALTGTASTKSISLAYLISWLPFTSPTPIWKPLTSSWIIGQSIFILMFWLVYNHSSYPIPPDYLPTGLLNPVPKLLSIRYLSNWCALAQPY